MELNQGELKANQLLIFSYYAYMPLLYTCIIIISTNGLLKGIRRNIYTDT